MLFSFFFVLSSLTFHAEELMNQTDREMVIAYSMTLSFGDEMMKLSDTMLYQSNYALEPVYSIQSDEHYTVDSGSANATIVPRLTKVTPKLSAYYLTNTITSTGFEFDLGNNPAVVRSYGYSDKQLGFTFKSDGLLPNSAGVMQTLRSASDTTINGHRCSVYISDWVYPSDFNNKPDSIRQTKIVIDKSKPHYCYTFIGKGICEKLGGAITLLETQYTSGITAGMEFGYREGFTSVEKKLMGKFMKEYRSYRHNSEKLKK